MIIFSANSAASNTKNVRALKTDSAMRDLPTKTGTITLAGSVFIDRVCERFDCDADHLFGESPEKKYEIADMATATGLLENPML